jgi:hypothetical protein
MTNFSKFKAYLVDKMNSPKCTIQVAENKFMLFPLNIIEYLKVGNIVLVSYHSDELHRKDRDGDSNRNIFAYNSDGQVCWRVSPTYYIDLNGVKIIDSDSLHSLTLNNGKVYATNAYSWRYEIDLNTGNLKNHKVLGR